MSADALQPNYLTVGADGTVGARFTGEVYADGIVLPADASGKAPPPLASRIEWTTDGTSDGGLVAVVAGTNFAGNNEVAVESYASTEGDQTATLLLQAFDDTGTLQTGIQILHDPPASPAQRVLAFAGNNPIATIIDSNGNSSFVKGIGVSASTWAGPDAGQTFGGVTDIYGSPLNIITKRPGASILAGFQLSLYAESAGSEIYKYMSLDGGGYVQLAGMFYFEQADIHLVAGPMALTLFENVAAGAHSIHLAVFDANALAGFNNADSASAFAIEMP